MIGFVDGTLEYITEDCAVINVNGFGINVFVPSNTLLNLPPIGERIRLYTYTCVREDAFLLYGFINRNDLDMFKKCITVNGIGPKGALCLLSSFTSDELRFAIITEDSKAIAKTPGIGVKTAQRLILELKGKIDYTASDINAEVKSNVLSQNSNVKEAIEALVALGYSNAESSSAISKISNIDELDSGEILKAALKNIF